MVGRHLHPAPVAGVHQALGMGVHIFIGKGRWRLQFRGALVKIPVFLARHERVVRMGKACGQAPGARIKAARQIVELLHRLMADVVIIFQLVGDLGHACAGDRAHVVIPPVNPLAGLAVIRGPAEIGGVDVGGQAFLEAVQLVGAYEMHLARKGGVIARAAQVVGIGGDVGCELGGVVIDPRAPGQGARHEGGAGRRTEGRGGVAVGKSH